MWRSPNHIKIKTQHLQHLFISYYNKFCSCCNRCNNWRELLHLKYVKFHIHITIRYTCFLRRTPCFICKIQYMFKMCDDSWNHISDLLEVIIELIFTIRLCCFIKMVDDFSIVKVNSNIFLNMPHAVTQMSWKLDNWNHF